MTVWRLKHEYFTHNPNGHFFVKETLRFFGERESDMRIFKNITTTIDFYGNEHKCYVLSTLQRNHPAGPTRKHHYFDVYTFELID